MDANPPPMQQPPSSSSQTPPSANPHTPSTSSTGPQIRSRITVVCAECKRLKLKCDRRAPCGSCTKRDTVVRCIYSPAAAEKVDLHSLNNRLIHVETLLAIVTAGQTPPAFQSVYPFSYPSGVANASSNPSPAFVPAHTGSHHHHHHHHYAAPSSYSSADDSIMLSLQDIASIWLKDLDLGVPWLFTSTPSVQEHLPSNSGYIKLEPSSIDFELSHSHYNSTASPLVIDVDTLHFSSRLPRSSSPLKDTHQQRSSAQLLLPALSIYYHVPSISPPGTSPASSSAFPHHPSTYPLPLPTSASGSSPSLPLPQPQYSRPQVTPALLALLPPLPRCKSLLQTARDVFRVRPVPFEPGSCKGWKGFESRCLALIGGGASQERERERARKEKAREAKRARQIYFGGIAGLPQDDTDMDESNGSGSRSKECTDEQGNPEEQSLTFFATMCAVLAIGAVVPSPAFPMAGLSAPTESPAFFYALSQQALGVWDTHTTSGTQALDEAERMDYLLACLIGVEYLLLSGSAGGSAEKGERDGGCGPVYALVGKLVTAARGMGLGQDSYSSRKSKAGLGGNDKRFNASGSISTRETTKKEKKAEKEREREEWRRMVLWDVMFYDLFTADVLGHQPYIASYSYSMKLPACSSHIVPSDGDDRGSDDEDPDFDSGIQMQPDEFNSQHRRQSILNSVAYGPADACERDETSYLGARYRLTQLAQAVKNRIAHPECCCGYTFDQAASLEDDIRRWQSSLPLSLKVPESALEASGPPSPVRDLPDGSNLTDKALHAQSCELATMANLLIVKIYLPFLRHAAASAAAVGQSTSLGTSSTSPSATGMTGGNSPAVPTSVSSPASQATVHAAQTIIRVAKNLQATQPSSKTDNSLSEVLPSMFDFYSLDKVVFDCVLICAHGALTGKTSTFAFDGAMLSDTVILGLNLLSELCSGPGLGETQKRVIEALYKRVLLRGGGMNLLKRKHDQVDGSSGVTATSYSTTKNPAAGSNGMTMMNGFDLSNVHATQDGQYLHDGPPIIQQQHNSLIDLSSSSNSSRSSAPPGSSIGSFPQDQLQRSEQQKTDLASAVTSVATVRLTRNGEKDQELEKEKKHPKKTHYPSVGIRVRPNKDGASRSRGQSASGSSGPQHPPLMTSTPRPLPSAESVLTYQQQLKQKTKTMASASGIPGGNKDDVQRSRSSSIKLARTEQQSRQRQPSDTDYTLPFGSPHQPSDAMDTETAHRKPFSMYDSTVQQQQLSPDHSPFSPRVFDQTHSTYDQQQSYDSGSASSGVHTDGMGYNAVSSPFSNSGGPPSSSGSPFASTSTTSSGHPATPTFNSHQPTPPVFGPQPPAPPPSASPTNYFHTPSTYNSSFGHSSSPPSLPNHHQSMSLSDMGLDQNMVPVPGTPVYDVKPSMDRHTQHHLLQQQHHMPRQPMGPPSNSYEDHEMPGHLSMGIASAPPWPPNQQQSQSPQPTQSYWDNDAAYRFYA
ncbi:hypothetical protein GALMADRAFT_267440 [Galerina marginata CBS 339.88]|uniref:Zn(2)-C6 fungal-type domain-containing protein n=1 Tax=Galerina marginata (strain CBS 339.88) TaxID=685588 RepID=A0A067TE72_GALM3|nr:hypothetical protein GALMADRAFT_267440 [Galerina marginata CBS 339.88]